MKRVVITGATSFIGIHLINQWLDRESELYAVIRPNSKNRERIPRNERIHILEVDMEDYTSLPELVDSADYFYHLAWEGVRNPYRDDCAIQKKNYECALQAYESAKRIGCKIFLGFGSQAEYGMTSGLVDEEYPCNPINEYGRQKYRACSELLNMADRDGIKLIWMRIFSLYGPFDYPGSLVMSSIEKMSHNEVIEMTAGTQLWDYLYVSDAAEAMVLLADHNCESGIYNIASGDYKPLRQFIEVIKRVLNSKSDLLFGIIPYGEAGPINLTPDSSKIKGLGWKPQIDFEDGIKRIVRNF